MNYKIMILSCLLLPMTIMGNDTDTQTRIQELKKARFEKQLELSNLGKIIIEKGELIYTYMKRIQEIFQEQLETQKAKLCEKRGVKTLQQDEINHLKNSLQDSLITFGEDFSTAAVSGNIKNYLVTNLCNAQTEECNLIRSIAVIRAFEATLLRRYIEQYEECLQEVINIERELDSLLVNH